jgi:DNA-binding CsgD family transcriptional regulator
MMAASAVIGRDAELEAIDRFLADVEHGPAALVLSGEAGIGKTILWETGVETARERFGRVLTSRGVEAEASLSFSGLSDLLGDALREAGPVLAQPRRRALEIALLLVEPDERPPDPHAIGLAVLDLLRALSGTGPVVIALDDLQWLDSASAGAIQIALRRLRDEPISLLTTVRLAPQAEEPFELERSFPEGRLERITVGPLSLGALHGLLAERLELELTRQELVRIQEATAGNPFFALELGRELVRTNTRPVAGRALQVPPSLRELIGGRLSRLPGETLDVLLQVSALARPTVELVAAADGDRGRVERGLEAAAREGVVELDDAQIRFTHPLLASVCYEQAPVWKRRAVHRTLAGVVPDSEDRARHLALAAEGPDGAVAEELDIAAERAAARGATAAAAQLFELAVGLTPDDAGAARRRLRAAVCHRLAGASQQAAAILERLLTETRAGKERADVLFELAQTYTAETSRTIALCDEALAEAAGDDVRCARILAFQSLYRLLQVDIRVALSDARAALASAERVGDPVLLVSSIARVGHAETYTAEITPGLLERGAEIERRLGLGLEHQNSSQFHLGRTALRLGKIDEARVIIEQAEAAASARGDEISRIVIVWYLAILEWYAGRLRSALDHASSATVAGEEAEFAHGRIWVARIRALIETDLGLVDEARASAEDGLAVSSVVGTHVFSLQGQGVLGRLELVQGNAEAAGRHLRDLPGRCLDGGYLDPALPLWADAIETLILLGELNQARAYLVQYEANAARLGNPGPIEAAARCRGLLAAAEGDVAVALAAFERSLAGAAPFPLERGRTLLCLGTVRRQAQQKRAAREALDQALAMFEDLEARLWAEKAHAELRRISGRRPADEELTETERRVAELATQGRTNREIAAELFMGVSTVESHLSRVYRKLGIRSRTDLAGSLDRVGA